MPIQVKGAINLVVHKHNKVGVCLYNVTWCHVSCQRRGIPVWQYCIKAVIMGSGYHRDMASNVESYVKLKQTNVFERFCGPNEYALCCDEIHSGSFAG